MTHLSDELLNEYLDNELSDRIQAEAHLAVCEDCAARLAALQALFNEIESLPEVPLSRSLRDASLWEAAPFTRDESLDAPLPRSLRLTVTLQATLAVAAIIFIAPFVMDFLAPYLSVIKPPSFADMFLQLQTRWTMRLDWLSQFKMPTIPEIPVMELSSLVITLTLAGASMLWLVGNGLLLRKQSK